MGNSWRMLEISAALGIIQLNNLRKNLKKRLIIEKIYSKELKDTNIYHSSIKHMSSASNYKFIIYGKSQNIQKK